ncbi:MAG: orotate phosphoribosyltransferase, partial [Methanobacteriota archaeon]
MVNDREFVAALRACGAVQFGSFTLASGKASDYYVDIKRATRPELLREIA